MRLCTGSQRQQYRHRIDWLGLDRINKHTRFIRSVLALLSMNLCVHAWVCFCWWWVKVHEKVCFLLWRMGRGYETLGGGGGRVGRGREGNYILYMGSFIDLQRTHPPPLHTHRIRGFLCCFLVPWAPLSQGGGISPLSRIFVTFGNYKNISP